ncbi:MAG: S-layer homology domain-containing protein [Syntrophomonadaceae bacterium]|nr:S-layer homology domain-containing protein [Syntrophomonadaceae bacterium]
MKNTLKHICLIMSLLLIVTYNSVAFANNSFPEQQAAQSINKALTYLHNIQNNDGGFPSKAGRSSSNALTSWVILALQAAGEDAASNNWAPAGATPVSFLRSNNFSQETTDYARLLMALTATGQEPVYQNINLAEKIISFQQSSGQFAQLDKGEKGYINSHMWSILALASAGYEIPNQEKAKQWLLSHQNKDGGFGWIEGTASDSDDTGIAIQTLVVLGEVPESSLAIKNALKYLKNCQVEDGGFNCGDDWMGSKSNAASDSWVLQGLIAAGENPVGEKWSINGKNSVSHLLNLQNSDGSFNFISDVCSSPVTMTAYTIMALAQKPFPINIVNNREKKPVTSSQTMFADLSANNWAYTSIMNLVEARVLSGYTDGTFKPDNNVSRAEFATYIICGLGQQEVNISGVHNFPDVLQEHWAYRFILISADQGYVTGMPDGSFNPNGKISGAELATMLVKALPAEKKAQMTAGSAWYSGYVKLAEENGLLYPNFQPQLNASRAQCAYSVNQLRNLMSQN